MKYIKVEIYADSCRIIDREGASKSLSVDGRYRCQQYSIAEMMIKKIDMEALCVSNSVRKALRRRVAEDKKRHDNQNRLNQKIKELSLEAANAAIQESLQTGLPVIYDSVSIGCGNIIERWFLAFGGKLNSIYLSIDDRYYLDEQINHFPYHQIPASIEVWEKRLRDPIFVQ